MPKHDFRLTAIIQRLENDTFISETLFFPEVSRYGADAKKLLDALKANAIRILETSPPLALHMRRGADPSGISPEIDEVTIHLDPPSRSVAWREPARLSFDLIRWQHADDGYLAYVPALGILVVERDPDTFEQVVSSNIHAHLLRIKKAGSLGDLIWLQRNRMTMLDQTSVTATIRAPKQIADGSEGRKEENKSVLDVVATDLTRERLAQRFELDDTVTRIAEALAGSNPRSVLLVGPSGVGKTAALHELVRRRHDFNLGRTPFWATSGSRLVAGMSGFGMWQERCGRLWREASKQKAILHLGNLLELMEVGKSASGSQGIAAFLRPYISRGDLLAVSECTSEQLPVIERDDPQLLEAFSQIKIEEPSIEKGKAILLGYALQSSGPKDVAIDIDGLETTDRLHRRYATYSAYPGRPLRFLRNLFEDREPGKPLSVEDVINAFSNETGLPLFLLNPTERLDLGETAKWFAERVIGQMDAVSLIVDLLAIVRARLARPRKPIASLMFIGPTGVGKTEMARSLAEFLFRSKERMIRFDMSEYASPLAVTRLIGGVWGAEGLLTSKVREQPFAVVLLDEFEKAHPSFFDLLLQVLGEGRLTDAQGRVADFSNSVVIMTSNLGAESFRRSSIGFGQESDEAARAREHFLSEVRAFVRPEFFNRIDRIVPFAPLDEQTILSIAKRELELLKNRDGILYRAVGLNIADDVAGYLARKGYDSRYGARPLKRVIERELLVPLAEVLNTQSSNESLSADVGVEGDRLSIAAQLRKEDESKRLAARADRGLGEIAREVAEIRRNSQRLEHSPAVLEAQNEIFNLERLKKRVSGQGWKRAEDMERLAQLPRLKLGMDRLKSFMEKISALEDKALLAVYGRVSGEKEKLAALLLALSGEWDEVLLCIYALQFKKPDYATLAVYGENPKWLFELAEAYCRAANNIGASLQVFKFASQATDSDQKRGDKSEQQIEMFELLGRPTIKQKVENVKEFFASARKEVVGIALGISAPLAYPRYEPERGLHLFVEEKQSTPCLVHTSEAAIAGYQPPAGLERRGSVGAQEKRRLFNQKEFVIEDTALRKKLSWQEISEAISGAIEQRIIKDANSLFAT